MPTSVDVHLGRRVRLRRKLLGWTQSDLGAAINQRFQQIQKYECAVTTISASMLWKLARAMEVDVQFFFDGFHEPTAGEAAHRESRSFGLRDDATEVGAYAPASAAPAPALAAMGASAG